MASLCIERKERNKTRAYWATKFSATWSRNAGRVVALTLSAWAAHVTQVSKQAVILKVCPHHDSMVANDRGSMHEHADHSEQAD